MKKVLMILLLTGVIIIGSISGILFYLSRDLDDTNNITIEGINLSNIPDGIYTGTYENGRFSNTVEVHVESQHITDIYIIDAVRFERTDVSESIIQSVIDSQRVDVDAISGATITTNAYLKAIESALKGDPIHE